MKLVTTATLLLTLALPIGAAEIESVKLPPTATVGVSQLTLNGAGLRKRMVIKVYVGSLYLPAVMTDGEAILKSSGAKRVRMDFLREVSAAQTVDTMRDGFKTNNSSADVEALLPTLDRFATEIGAVPVIKKGDSVTWDWLPGTGMVYAINGKPVGAAVKDEKFYLAFLRNLVGAKPGDSDLKAALLAGKAN
jgi:hypothetical protein